MKINLTLLSILLLAFTQKFSSARFIVYVAHYTPPNLNTALPRCAGTIISPSHILSTASCVMVDAQTAVAVLVRTENEDYLVNSKRVNVIATKLIYRDFINRNCSANGNLHPSGIQQCAKPDVQRCHFESKRQLS